MADWSFDSIMIFCWNMYLFVEVFLNNTLLCTGVDLTNTGPILGALTYSKMGDLDLTFKIVTSHPPSRAPNDT